MKFQQIILSEQNRLLHQISFLTKNKSGSSGRVGGDISNFWFNESVWSQINLTKDEIFSFESLNKILSYPFQIVLLRFLLFYSYLLNIICKKIQ